MTVAVSVSAGDGAEAVVCASTGNTSASAAAYAARAGLRPVVLLPAGKIAAGKLAQAIVHGAQVVQIQGNFDDCLRLARRLAEHYPVSLVNSVNPVRIEGQKTAAFEIVDALGDAPDLHVLPVGNGGNISAYWRGYTQYAEAGLASRTAADVGLSGHRRRSSGARPAGDDPGDGGDRDPDRQSGLDRVWRSPRSSESGGLFEAVTDEEILAAQGVSGRTGGCLRRAGLGRRGGRTAGPPTSAARSIVISRS